MFEDVDSHTPFLHHSTHIRAAHPFKTNKNWQTKNRKMKKKSGADCATQHCDNSSQSATMGGVQVVSVS